MMASFDGDDHAAVVTAKARDEQAGLYDGVQKMEGPGRRRRWAAGAARRSGGHGSMRAALSRLYGEAPGGAAGGSSQQMDA
jgi:hypothetical protein